MKHVLVVLILLSSSAYADSLKLKVYPSTGEIVEKPKSPCGIETVRAVRAIIGKQPTIAIIDANMIVTIGDRQRMADRYADADLFEPITAFFDQPDGKIIRVSVRPDTIVTVNTDQSHRYKVVEISMLLRDHTEAACYETWLGLAEIQGVTTRP